jgi:hypothetical protein
METGRKTESHARDEWIPEPNASQVEVAVRPEEFSHFTL